MRAREPVIYELVKTSGGGYLGRVTEIEFLAPIKFAEKPRTMKGYIWQNAEGIKPHL
jgi:hypothetical protein